MRQAPMWPEAVAPRLAYDAATLGEDRSVPTQNAAKITSPTLVSPDANGWARRR
jgi:hypothetical protein